MMNIGIPKERRPFEFRVGLSPAGVEILTHQGHVVFLEHGAGLGAGFSDQQYEQAGARIVYSPHEAFGRAELILKLARPMQDEVEWLNPGTTMMGFFHLASSRQDRVQALLNNKINAVAYEQIENADGSMPVLRPLSQIGGQLAGQIAARYLQTNYGGKGILIGGIAGVPPAEVVILGGGVAGSNAAKVFTGMGAHVTVLDKDINVLQHICELYPQVVTMISTHRNIEKACAFADVVVGAVMVHGERSPILVTRETMKKMKPRSLLLDLSIDLGGCFETSRPTTHDQPTYVEEGMIHYCVPNVPAMVARTATYAFVNAAIPFISEIAAVGIDQAMQNNAAIELGVNTYKGELMHLQQWNSVEGD
ncbi:MAG: alanine dehydrogenase [Chloroflexota bacterium]